MGDRRWQRALVTGASAGIGDSFARELAAEGTDLVIVARNRSRLEDLATDLHAGHGVQIEVVVADLADPDELAVVEERVAAETDRVDLLVNNAGYGLSGRFGTVGVDEEEAEIRVNVVALVRLTHAAVGQMSDAGGGGILNVSSMAAFQPGPSSANYSATKAYVLSFSQSVHEDLAASEVHVSVLCPGLTRTEFQERGGYEVTSVPGFMWQDARPVARAGLDGVAVNHAVVVPGLHNRAAAATLRLVPMGAARRAAAAVVARTR